MVAHRHVKPCGAPGHRLAVAAQDEAHELRQRGGQRFAGGLVGVEKRDLMNVQFGPMDLEAQMWLKDVFDPKWLLNAAKVFPLESAQAHRAAQLAAE